MMKKKNSYVCTHWWYEAWTLVVETNFCILIKIMMQITKEDISNYDNDIIMQITNEDISNL